MTDGAGSTVLHSPFSFLVFVRHFRLRPSSPSSSVILVFVPHSSPLPCSNPGILRAAGLSLSIGRSHLQKKRTGINAYGTPGGDGDGRARDWGDGGRRDAHLCR